MENKSRRIIIAAGGTGGHLYPALVLADYWQKKFGEGTTHLIVRRDSRFQKLLEEKKLFTSTIPVTGLKRKVSLQLLVYPFTIIGAIIKSLRIIRKFHPDYILGFGSYVSFPVVLAGAFFRIPVFLHEQNCFPGLANRCLAVLAKKIFISFSESAKYFPPEKVVFSGYPVRPEIRAVAAQLQPEYSEKIVNILILGGSQGAHSINQVIPKILSRDKELSKKVKIVHLAGEKDFPVLKSFYRENNISAEVYAYFDNIAELYRRADLVFSRAGAGTIAELLVLGRPAILVPYPAATAGHQKINARVLADIGQGYVVEESGNWEEKLSQKLHELVLENQLQLWYNKKPSEIRKKTLVSNSDSPEEIIVRNIIEK